MCLYPKLLKNPKYKPNKKNGGQVPVPKDVRALYVPIGCQKCIECRKQKSRDWQVRLLEDVRHNKNGKFVTLTFSNESYTELYKEINPRLLITVKGEIEEAKKTPYEIDNAIATLAMRRFLERWRKKHKKSLRHWMVTELGHNGTENIHLHGIIWTNEDIRQLKDIWKYGYVWIGEDQYSKKITNYVNEQTINYITKYVSKMDERHKYYNSIVLTSPGIGKAYTSRHDSNNNKFNGKSTKEYYRTREGYKIALPIYYRNKIYTDEEKEQLWLQRIDKGERWVCKEKATTNEQYWNLLDWHRQRNKLLGYGNDEIDWSRKYYEEQVRLIKQAARINNENKAPSAGSNQKGLDYISPTKEENTGNLKGWNNYTAKKKSVAPAVGCERLQLLADIRKDGEHIGKGKSIHMKHWDKIKYDAPF